MAFARRWAAAAAHAAVFLVCAAAAARTIALDAFPDGDSAYVAMRIRDATSGRPPLVGMPTTLAMTVEQASHLGPLPFFPAGVLDRLFLRSSWSLPVGTAIVNALALSSAVHAARRAWGPLASVLTAAGGGWLFWSLGNEVATDVLNTSTPVVPCFAGAMCLAAAVDRRPTLLPLAVLWLSWAAQAHLAFGPVGLVGTASAVVLALLPRTPLDRRWRLGIVAVATVCWAPVLLDELLHDPGNLSALARATRASADEGTAGLDFALVHAGRIIGLPPPFGARPHEAPIYVPEGGGTGTAALLVLPAAAALGAILVARRQGRRWAPVALPAGLAVVAVAACSRASFGLGGVPQSYLRVLWPVALATWLTIAVSLARSTTWRGDRAAAAWTLAAVALASTTAAGAVARRDGVDEGDAIVRTELVAEALDAVDADGRTVVVTTEGINAVDHVGPMLVAELQRLGVRARVLRTPVVPVRSYREQRVVDEAPADALQLYVGPPEGAPPDARVVARSPRLDRSAADELARFDRRLTEDLLAGRGTEVTELGRYLAGGPITAARAEELVRNRRYAVLLTGDLVEDVPLEEAEVERYLDLVRQADPFWDVVVAVRHPVAEWPSGRP